MSSHRKFVAELAGISFEDTFNPYRDRCEVFDYQSSPSTRRGMLSSVLDAACAGGTDALWIGRDLGYRGGRRTGLALTDQIHVEAHLHRWGVAAKGRALVKGVAQAERTASVIWRMLSQIQESVFLWNVFPLHPHEPDKPFTNRAHTSKERAAGEEVLRELIELLQPKQVIAIGRDAAESAERCAGARTVVSVRHPSYGGLRDFERGLTSTYGLPVQRDFGFEALSSLS